MVLVQFRPEENVALQSNSCKNLFARIETMYVHMRSNTISNEKCIWKKFQSAPLSIYKKKDNHTEHKIYNQVDRDKKGNNEMKKNEKHKPSSTIQIMLRLIRF